MTLECDTYWEFNKENIIPLIGGRSSEIIKGLSKNDINIEQTKADFEEQLKLYYNNKIQLLHIWLEYINWHEQYITTGKGLRELIERALSMLDQTKDLFQNEKYLKIWLRYITILDEKDETFKYLISNGIGYDHTILYSTYAYFCEVSGNCKQADEVYKLGINRRAQPLDDLKQSYKDFMHRLQYKKVDQENNQIDQPDRIAFTNILEETGEVANDRITNLPLAKPFRSELLDDLNKNELDFNVYSDNSIAAKKFKGGWQHPLIKSMYDKDNNLRPTSWQGVRITSGKITNSQPDITIKGIFQDDERLKPTKDRYHLLYPSLVPTIEATTKPIPWIVATEIETEGYGNECSMEELMSIRFYHLKYCELIHPVKSQLTERVKNLPRKLKVFVNF